MKTREIYELDTLDTRTIDEQATAIFFKKIMENPNNKYTLRYTRENGDEVTLKWNHGLFKNKIYA